MVGVRNRHRQRIGGIRARDLHSGQQPRDHRVDLRFFRAAGADHRLLDDAGRIFADIQPVPRRGQQYDATCLAELQRGLRVHVDEDLFHRRRLRTMTQEQIVQRVVQRDQAGGQGSSAAGLHLPVGNVTEPIAIRRDYAPAGGAEAGIEADEDQPSFSMTSSEMS